MARRRSGARLAPLRHTAFGDDAALSTAPRDNVTSCEAGSSTSVARLGWPGHGHQLAGPCTERVGPAGTHRSGGLIPPDLPGRVTGPDPAHAGAPGHGRAPWTGAARPAGFAGCRCTRAKRDHPARQRTRSSARAASESRGASCTGARALSTTWTTLLHRCKSLFHNLDDPLAPVQEPPRKPESSIAPLQQRRRESAAGSALPAIA
jgi:hypothetical protein